MILKTSWTTPTMNHLPRVIIAFLLLFFILFRLKKSFLKMVLLFIGAVLCQGGRTVCGCLRALGMQGEKAFAYLFLDD